MCLFFYFGVVESRCEALHGNTSIRMQPMPTKVARMPERKLKGFRSRYIRVVKRFIFVFLIASLRLRYVDTGLVRQPGVWSLVATNWAANNSWYRRAYSSCSFCTHSRPCMTTKIWLYRRRRQKTSRCWMKEQGLTMRTPEREPES